MDNLAAFKNFSDPRVSLEELEGVVRVEARVLVINPSHQADRDAGVRQSIDEPAAELSRRQRPAGGVDDLPACNAPGGNFPELLDSRRVHLRVTPALETHAFDQLLGQRAARPFRE